MAPDPPREMELDPVFRNAVREALGILFIFAAALIYTVAYCYLFGYGRDAETIATYGGIPDWVWWGILLPWVLCAAITVWFSFFYLKDDDLGGDLEVEFPDQKLDGPDAGGK